MRKLTPAELLRVVISAAPLTRSHKRLEGKGLASRNPVKARQPASPVALRASLTGASVALQRPSMRARLGMSRFCEPVR